MYEFFPQRAPTQQTKNGVIEIARDRIYCLVIMIY